MVGDLSESNKFLDSLGEHRESCDITCEDLTHTTVAFSNKVSVIRAKN